MPLTLHQELALPSFRWLIGRNERFERLTGKSYLLGYCFILEAIDTGRWIEVWDHLQHPRNTQSILDTIKTIMNTDFNDYDLKINVITNSIRVNYKKELK